MQSTNVIAVAACTPHPVQADAESIHSTDECTPVSLSVDMERAALQTNIPVNCLEGIWKKALDLIRRTNAIVLAPKQDEAARMVLVTVVILHTWLCPRKGGGGGWL